MRDDLKRAFNDCVRLKGREAALSAVEKVSGQAFVTKAPDTLADVVIAELRGGLTAAKTSPVARLQVVHTALNSLAASIFVQRKTKGLKES
jgi:hypothetical protein